MDKLVDLEKSRKELEEKLGTSTTAYSRNIEPSTKDLSLSAQLNAVRKQIESMKSEQRGNQWYGSDDTSADSPSKPDGFFVKGLKVLQKPTSAIVGGIQYALGKGTETSLTKNINEAMKTGLTSGDVLEQYGVGRTAQVPLGFALDVMLDPINWATVGTAALIPRVGTGLVKGGLKGASTGLTSSLEKKATTTLSLVPFAKKSEKFSGILEGIGKKAVSGAEEYDKLVGKNVYDKLGITPLGFQAGKIGEFTEDVISKIPEVSIGSKKIGGENIVDFFKYSTKQASDIADLNDKVINLAKNKGALLVRTEQGADFKSIDDFLKQDATIKIPDKVGEMMDFSIREADGTLKKDYIGQIKIYDNFENAQKLLETAGEDYNLKHLVSAYKKTPVGKTGVQWYDDTIDKLKNTTLKDLGQGKLGPKIIEDVKEDADNLVKTWNSYDKVTDLKPFAALLKANDVLLPAFKLAKVAMNTSSHVVAYLGNFFMVAMMGLPVQKAEYVNSLVKANKLVRGKLSATGFKEMFFDDVASLIDMADNNPTRFKQLTGLDPNEIARKLSAEQKITQALSPESGMEEVKKVMQEALEYVERGGAEFERLSALEKTAGEVADIESTSKLSKELLEKRTPKFKTPSEKLEEMVKNAPIRRAEEYGSWVTGEITPNAKLDAVRAYIAKKAETNYAYKAASLLVNSMPKWYEQIDQTFKIGTADYLSKIGLTESELVTISRTVPLTRNDILEPVVRGAEKLYRITPLKAAEIATEAYMNYSAMPDFVRVMRAVPFAGAPFMSFPYAMAIKTGKTLINNPTVFNKVGFMIDEMNAGRTPEEKAAMETKYNEYLNSPTVVKMFGMWNTDVKNFVPYYTMNMFNPSERTYDDSTQSKILKMTDKIPMFQHPVGQVIKDYFIQPWILSGTGQTAQGQFGQPLYPAYDKEGKQIDVGIGTKSFYAGRTLAESLVPGSLSYLGLLNAPIGASPEVIDYIPSYGIRSMANATQGRSSIGKETKEDNIRKTLRAVLSRTGIPAYNLDPTKSQTKK